MSKNANNVHIGAGTLTLEFSADEGPIDIGYTRGFNLEANTKILDIFADQALDPIDQLIIGRDTKGTVELLEMTMRNLVVTLGGDPADVELDEETHTYTYTIKSNLVAPPSAKLIYTVARPKDPTKNIVVTLLKVQSSGGMKLMFVKDKENAFTFAFKALATDVNDEQVLGSIVMQQYDTEYTP